MSRVQFPPWSEFFSVLELHNSMTLANRSDRYWKSSLSLGSLVLTQPSIDAIGVWHCARSLLLEDLDLFQTVIIRYIFYSDDWLWKHTRHMTSAIKVLYIYLVSRKWMPKLSLIWGVLFEWPKNQASSWLEVGQCYPHIWYKCNIHITNTIGVIHKTLDGDLSSWKSYFLPS